VDEAVSAVAMGAKPTVQEACNKSAAIAANTATFPLHRNIFQMVTCKVLQLKDRNVDFTGSILFDPKLRV
jgi:hypothetical protein